MCTFNDSKFKNDDDDYDDADEQPADKVTGGGGEHPLGEKLPDGFEDNSGNNRSRGRGSISCQTMQCHFIS